MIDEVMRLSAVFASMMASSTFALAIVIGVAGTIDRQAAGCYGCLDVRTALVRPAEPERGRLAVASLELRAH